MDNKNQKESKALMIDYDAKQLAKDVSTHLQPAILQIVENIEKKKANEQKKPLSMAQARDYLGVSTVTFSKLVGKGVIKYHSLNKNYPRARKFFYKKDLDAFLEKNRVMTIDELRQGK